MRNRQQQPSTFDELEQMLRMYDRFAPAAQADTALKQEQVAKSQSDRGLDPMRGEFMQAQIAALLGENERATNLNPLQMRKLEAEADNEAIKAGVASRYAAPREQAAIAGLEAQTDYQRAMLAPALQQLVESLDPGLTQELMPQIFAKSGLQTSPESFQHLQSNTGFDEIIRMIADGNVTDPRAQALLRIFQGNINANK